MSIFCSYCNALKMAVRNNNYCSNTGDDIQTIGSNAFYLNAGHIHSGKHLSRLTIRAVIKGYQYYNVENTDHLVKADNCLIVNEGQSYFSEIQSEEPLEALVVAFRSGFLEEVYSSLSKSNEDLLADPNLTQSTPIHFFENTYPKSTTIQRLLLQLKEAIISGEKDVLYYEEQYFNLMASMLQLHEETLKVIGKIPSRKKSTREELFRRLSLAKDYMDAHFNHALSLEKIGRVATLSPYHFIRMFKRVYGLTPHQYLTKERLNYAHYQIRNSQKTIGQICVDAGFENHSSFSRLFKSQFGAYPSALRSILRRKN